MFETDLHCVCGGGIKNGIDVIFNFIIMIFGDFMI